MRGDVHCRNPVSTCSLHLTLFLEMKILITYLILHKIFFLFLPLSPFKNNTFINSLRIPYVHTMYFGHAHSQLFPSLSHAHAHTSTHAHPVCAAHVPMGMEPSGAQPIRGHTLNGN